MLLWVPENWVPSSIKVSLGSSSLLRNTLDLKSRELWIFATEQYYANKRQLLKADLSDFVTIISSNLGKSVLNWYRVFVAECERVNMHATWSPFKSQLRSRFRPNDFEYGLRERMFRLKQTNSIHDYVSNFLDLMSQTEIATSHNKRFDNKKTKNDDWIKTAKCNDCGEIGHISPQCKQPKRKEANRFMIGSVYAILEVKAKAYVNVDRKHDVSIFIGNGSSLDGVSEELVKRLNLEVNEHELMKVTLGTTK
ncbi:Hypothetical protein PHPALM_14102 [Phytophthora palmivora]|uniref:CCHC-type domain-containing protein n=1 Tax=Phytophthora palmivora TaxID=4796 RepID=A0A2P4XVL6_9STRA|nr:Hypothetical protein PHPALM_14102 [Phytophthora palmivora]